MNTSIMSDEVVLSARGVCKSYGDLEVLKGIDLSVHRGETAVIVGPSGSGKSTFLRCINRLETIEAGLIVVEGDVVGTGEMETNFTNCVIVRSRHSGRKSAWFSNNSICSVI
jgi:ABC-type polar amino acid transport system ATPase subunit